MDSTNKTAAQIIDSEFGNENAGRFPLNRYKFWPDLLERIVELCEEAAKREKHNLMALGKNEQADYDKARETIVMAHPSCAGIITLTGKIEDLLKSHIMDKMPDLDLNEKSESVELPVISENGCANVAICKYYKAESEH